MEPPSFTTTGPQLVRVAPGSNASIVLPLPSGSAPFHYEWRRAGATLDDRFSRSDDPKGVCLTITAARTDDTGVYTLQASNAAGNDTTRVRLEVSPDEMPVGEDPPTFLRRLQDLTVKVGTRTRFLVEIVSSTECRVTWYRNERRLLEAERIALVRDGNFWCADIATVSVDDAGRWTCTSENAGGRASCSAHLNVLVPKAYKRPEFVEELRALLTEQGTVSLECKVVGVPTPVLRWFKDGREIKAGDVFALTANAEDPTSLGTYTCEAVNCMGRAYSSSKVHVVGRASREGSTRPNSGGMTPEPPPIFTRELEDKFVRICEPLTLSCHVVVPPWPRSVIWYNKEGKIEGSEKYHVLEDGVGGYLLEIPSAEWPDEGEWKCVATSPGGRVGISTCYVSMDVPKNYRKPRFMENLQAVLTEEGLVSFECKVVGFPTPVLSWFKDGQELKPGDVYQLTGTNSLGSYCCIAKNCMGQASSSAELTVEDIQNQLNDDEKLQLFSRNQAPKFLQGLKSVEAKIDEPFRFTIKVSIPPEPSVLWYRDDQPVDESSRCHHGKEDRGVFFLDMQKLEFMDQAEWKCVAMNDYGHSVTSCFLKLLIPRHYKKPRFLENLQAILSDEGAVNLECKVIGVPQPILKWYKDGEELKPGDIHRIISGQDGTCCLGTYTCEAQNCMGIAASSASLLGFEDSLKTKSNKKADELSLQRNLSLSTIHEERTSQMYDTPVGDITLDDKGEISFSFDGKEVSVSLYETPDLTEEEALQIVEMYADQLSENVTEHNVVELPPLRFVKETSTSGNLLMEAIIIDVSPEYFASPEEDLRTEADVEDISIADENALPQLSLDQELSGEDYLEKPMALLSDEKADLPKKPLRRKSDSQKSGDDFFSLSKGESFSEEKKDDDTQSDLHSFASARSLEKPKSKSPKPSIDEGQESSDVTKTVILKEEVQKQHHERIRLRRHSRKSSSSSEKSLDKNNEELSEFLGERIPLRTVTESTRKKVELKSFIKVISNSLDKIINDIQIIEKDIVLKSEFMSTAAAASRSLELINGLFNSLTEIQCITDVMKENLCESLDVNNSLVTKLPEAFKSLHQSLTVLEKCIEVENDNKTLVQKTCTLFFEICGDEMQNLVNQFNLILSTDYILADEICLSNIKSQTNAILSTVRLSTNIIKSKLNETEVQSARLDEYTELKHLKDTQKAVQELRIPLNLLLYVVEGSDSSNLTGVKNSEVILNDMSTSIQDLQNALEQIESLSVKESATSLQKYNTEIIVTVMNSVLKLRSSFEELSSETSKVQDEETLNPVLIAIKSNLTELSFQLDDIEKRIGSFDVLQNENKLEVLQKMAQVLICFENRLQMIESLPNLKREMVIFHKNVTKILENVIESNESSRYLALMEICAAVNRINSLLQGVETENELSLVGINNTLKIIQANMSKNVFPSELRLILSDNIANLVVTIQETINLAVENSSKIDSEHFEDIVISMNDEKKATITTEYIELTIAAIDKMIAFESTQDIPIKQAFENIRPLLVELKQSVASLTIHEVPHEETSVVSDSSFDQTFAKPLYELHKNITVLSETLHENAGTDFYPQIIEACAEPLLELNNTLEILQQDIVSQYGDDVSLHEVICSIANVVQSLQSCVLIVQEQAGIEGVDEMSTLEDVSGIKTIAESLPVDQLILPLVEETTTEQSVDSLKQEVQPSALAQAIQTLNEHIHILHNPDIIDILDALPDNEYSSIKSVIPKLLELNSSIECLTPPILMESYHDISESIIPVRLNAIIEPLRELQQSLSVIDFDNFPIRQSVELLTTEKINSIQGSLLQLKEHSDICLNVLISAIDVADATIDVSTNIKKLRELCEKLKLILESPSQDLKRSKKTHEVVLLNETIEQFLLVTGNNTIDINFDKVKIMISKIYEAVVAAEDKIMEYAVDPALLTLAANKLHTIDDIKRNITALSECHFVDLSEIINLPVTDPSQCIKDVGEDSLLLGKTITENMCHTSHNLSLKIPTADLITVQDFLNKCSNEVFVINYFIKKSINHKVIIRLVQEHSNLQKTIKDFKLVLNELNLPEDLNQQVTILILDSDEYLINLKNFVYKILNSQSQLLWGLPMRVISGGVDIYEEIVNSNDFKNIHELTHFLMSISSVVYPYLENFQYLTIELLENYEDLETDTDKLVAKSFTDLLSHISKQLVLQSSDDISCKFFKEISHIIQQHLDFENASGLAKKLIIIKCLSECQIMLKNYIAMSKPPESTSKLMHPDKKNKFVIEKINKPLEALHTELNNVIKHLEEDEESFDLLTTQLVLFDINQQIKEYAQTKPLIINADEITVIKELDEAIHSIKNDILKLQDTEYMKKIKDIICEPIDVIEQSLHVILDSTKECDNNGGRITKEDTKNLLLHMEQLIDIIEIEEEVCVIVKIDDLRDTSNIAKDLWESFVASESQVDVMTEGVLQENISPDQLQLAKKLQSSLNSLLAQLLDNSGKLISIPEKDKCKQMIQIISQLQSDLLLVACTENVKAELNEEAENILQMYNAELKEEHNNISDELNTVKVETLKDEVLNSIKPDDTHFKTDTTMETEKTLPSEVSTKDIVYTELPQDVVETLPCLHENKGENSSCWKLEMLLQEINNVIDSATLDNLPERNEALQNTLDEIQTIIIKLKQDYDGALHENLNENLEDLECSVRSVQLQINEGSPPELLIETCSTLQSLVTNITEIEKIPLVQKAQMSMNNLINDSLNDAEKTIELLDVAISTDDGELLSGIILNLRNIKDNMNVLKMLFSDNETLINRGIEVMQNLNHIEDKIFSLEKDIETIESIDYLIKDSIVTAVHAVYGSLSNMRGTLASIQKRYLYENYGKPFEYFLRSIKYVGLIFKYDGKASWKTLAKSLRKVLNHFEDIKFYINQDKTARLPNDAAFTKILLNKFCETLSEVILEDIDPDVKKSLISALDYARKTQIEFEGRASLEVREKIPVFKELAVKMLNVAESIKDQLINFECLNETLIKLSEKNQQVTEDDTLFKNICSEKKEADTTDNTVNIEELNQIKEEKVITELAGVVRTSPNIIVDDRESERLLSEKEAYTDLDVIEKEEAMPHQEQESMSFASEIKVLDSEKKQQVDEHSVQTDTQESVCEQKTQVLMETNEDGAELKLNKNVTDNDTETSLTNVDTEERDQKEVMSYTETQTEETYQRSEERTETSIKPCHRQQIKEEKHLMSEEQEETTQLQEEGKLVEEIEMDEITKQEDEQPLTQKDAQQLQKELEIKTQKEEYEIKMLEEEKQRMSKEQVETTQLQAEVQFVKESEVSEMKKQEDEQTLTKKEPIDAQQLRKELEIKTQKDEFDAELQKEQNDSDRLQIKETKLGRERCDAETKMLKEKQLHIRKEDAKLQETLESEKQGQKLDALVQKDQSDTEQFQKANESQLSKKSKEAEIKKQEEDQFHLKKEEVSQLQEELKIITQKEEIDTLIETEQADTKRLQEEKESQPSTASDEAKIKKQEEDQLRIGKEQKKANLQKEQVDTELLQKESLYAEASEKAEIKEQGDLRIKKEQEDAKLQDELKIKKRKEEHDALVQIENAVADSSQKEKQCQLAKSSKEAEIKKQEGNQLRIRKEEEDANLQEEVEIKKQKEEHVALVQKEQAEAGQLQKEQESQLAKASEDSKIKKQEEDQQSIKNEKQDAKIQEELEIKRQTEEHDALAQKDQAEAEQLQKENEPQRAKENEKAKIKNQEDQVCVKKDEEEDAKLQEKPKIKRQKEKESQLDRASEEALTKRQEEDQLRISKEQEDAKLQEELEIKRQKDDHDALLNKDQVEAERLQKEKEPQLANKNEENKMKNQEEDQLHIRKEQDDAKLQDELGIKRQKEEHDALVQKDQVEAEQLHKKNVPQLAKENEEAKIKKQEDQLHVKKEDEEDAKLQEKPEIKRQKEKESQLDRASEEALMKKQEEDQFRIKKEKEDAKLQEELEIKEQKEEHDVLVQKEQAEAERLQKVKQFQLEASEETKIKKEEEDQLRIKKDQEDVNLQEELKIKRQKEENDAFVQQKQAESEQSQKETKSQLAEESQDAKIKEQEEDQRCIKNEQKDVKLQYDPELKGQKGEHDVLVLKEEAEAEQLENEKASQLAKVSEEVKIKKQEEDQFRLRQEQEDAQLQEELEIKRQKEEHDALVQKEQAEAERLQKEKESQLAKASEKAEIKKQEEDQLRIKKEQEDAKLQEELKIKGQKEEYDALVQKEQAEAERLQKEKESQLVKASEKAEIKKQEEDQLRIRKEQEDAKLQVELEIKRQKEEHDALVKKEQAEAERLQKEKESQDVKAREEAKIKKEEEDQLLIKIEQEDAKLQEELKIKRQKEKQDAFVQKEHDEAERLQKEKESQLAKASEEAKIKKQEENQLRIRKEQEGAKLQEELEIKRQKEEQDAFVQKEQAEAERLQKEKESQLAKASEEAEIKKHEENQLRIRKEQEDAKLQEELKIKRQKEEQDAFVQKEHDEAERLQKEKESQLAKASEEARIKKQEDDQLLIRKEQEDAKLQEELEIKRQKEEHDALVKKEQAEAERLQNEKESQLAKASEEAKIKKQEENQLRIRKEQEDAKLQEELKIKEQKEEYDALVQKEQAEAEQLNKEKESQLAKASKKAEIKKQEEDQLRIRKEQEDAKLQEELEIKRQKEEHDALVQKEQAEAKRLQKEKESQLAKASEEAKIKKQEDDQLLIRKEQEDAKLQEELEIKRQKEEHDALVQKEPAEAERLQKEKESQLAKASEKAEIKKQEEDQLRIKKEQEVAKLQEELEIKRQKEEHDALVQKEQAEAKRLQKEKESQLAKASEEARIKKQEDDQLLIRKEQEDAKLQEELEIKRQKEEHDALVKKEQAEAERLQNEKESQLAKASEEAKIKKQEENQLRIRKEQEDAKLQEELKIKEQKEEYDALVQKEQAEAEQLNKEKESQYAKASEKAEIKKQEEDQLRIKKEQEVAKLQEELEIKRQKEEHDALVKKEQAEAERLQNEKESQLAKASEEAKIKKHEENQLRIRKEQEDAKLQEELEIKRQKEEQDAFVQKEHDEAERLQKEKESQLAKTSEKAEIKKQKEDQLRIKKEQEVANLQEELEIKRQKEEQDAFVQKEHDEAERLQKEKESQLTKASEEAKIKKQEENQLCIRKEEEDATLQEELEIKRQKEEHDALVQKEQAEAERLQKEKESQLAKASEKAEIKKQEEDQLLIREEQEDAKLQEELEIKEQKRKHDDLVQKEQAEAERLQKEQEFRLAKASEEAKMKKQEENQLRIKKEQEDAKLQEELEIKIRKEQHDALIQKEQADTERLHKEKESQLAKKSEEDKIKMQEEDQPLMRKDQIDIKLLLKDEISQEIEEIKKEISKESEELSNVIQMQEGVKEWPIKKESKVNKENETNDTKLLKEDIYIENDEQRKKKKSRTAKKYTEMDEEENFTRDEIPKNYKITDSDVLNKEKRETQTKDEANSRKEIKTSENFISSGQNGYSDLNGSARTQKTDLLTTSVKNNYDNTDLFGVEKTNTADKSADSGNTIVAHKPIFIDRNKTDFSLEFSRPPSYIQKTSQNEELLPHISIENKKPFIYKSQTLLYGSQLRSSTPRLLEKQTEINQRSKISCERGITLAERRTTTSRDHKKKPIFSTFLTDRTAVEGSRVKLTCSVLSSSEPAITWYKNGVILDNKQKYKIKYVDGLITMEVLNAIPSDSAEYKCTVENEHGSITSFANLRVYPSFEASPIPPTFTRSIKDTYHLAENELVLECRIRGQPLPTITWMKDQVPISSPNERYQACYLADGVCRLVISSPTPADSGKYTCKAENSMWSDHISHVVQFTGNESRPDLNIATIEKSRFNRLALESRRPHFTNVLSDYKVLTGGTIGLQVEIKGTPTRVEWLREGVSVVDISKNTETFVDQGTYTLALSDVTVKESGLYTCRAWSSYGNVDMNASVTVVQPNEIEGKSAIIVSRPEKRILITVGDDINISFRVQGEPRAKVIFMKGIRDITNNQRVCKMVSDDYVKFTLKRSVVSDAGTYCILARNAYGCDRAFVTVEVRQRASSVNLISDWTYPMDSAISIIDRTYKSVPDRIPGEPSVVDGGNNWISLAWPKSDLEARTPILAYKIESWLLGKEGGARWVELGITPRNSYDAFNLKQGEEYHFRVTPRNRYGWGEPVQTSNPIGIGLAGDRPEFVQFLPGQLKVLVGEAATLNCSFKGKPTPEILWMKNGHEIDEDDRIRILLNGQDSSLNIQDVRIEDEGRYSCEATNMHGRASTYARMAVITDRLIWEADAKLKRERSAGAEGEYPPQFTMRLRDRRVQATYPVRLTCQVIGSPSPTVTWFKNGEEVFDNGRHTTSQDEYFHTLEIAPTALDDGGVYEAMARNGCGAISCRCNLVVDKGIRAYIAPEFCCGLEPLYRLSEGEELRISAIVEAYPSVGVTWYRDGVRLRPSRRTIMTLDRDGQIELALAAITGRDAGVYSCTASNEVGKATTSGKVEVIAEQTQEKFKTPPVVISPDIPYSKEPMFIRKPRSSEAREGDTVIIECEVIGDPKPDVYWLRDFLKPDYYRDAIHFKLVDAGPEYRLEIPHAKLDYTGAYSVVARNVHGEAKAIISLQILAKDPRSSDEAHNVRYGRVDVIPRFVKNLTDLLCYDGDAIEFECRVSGNPEPYVRWFHYHEVVPECDDFETTLDDGTARLKIKQVTAEDEGTYICEASNSLGKATSSACLVVYPPGEPNTLSQRLRRPPALLSATSTPRSTPRSTPARSASRTPGRDLRQLCSPTREIAPKFYTYPFNKVVEEGDNVVFKCAVKGLPSPWATWDKDGIIITPSARITVKEKDEIHRILEIDEVTVEDVGLYRITLENDYGRAEASARLEVISHKGKFYGSTRSYSASPRRSLPYRRRTPSLSRYE